MNETWVVYKPYYFYPILTMSVLSLMAHTIALYAIHLSKRKTNQNIILASFSAAMVIHSGHRVWYEFATRKQEGMIRDNESLYKYGTLHFIYTVLVNVLLNTMTVLTADRLAMVVSPLKYKSRVTRRRVIIAIAICWCAGVAFGAISRFHGNIDKYRLTVTMFIAGFYLILVSVTYSFIVFKIRESRRIFVNVQEERIKFRKEFLIPMILIATYIFLYSAPLFFINVYP